MIRGRSQFAALLLLAALLLAGGEFGVSIAGAGPARSPAAPGELLSDGYDALGANRPDLAAKIFQTLLNAYPQSNEAATAADELANIESSAGAAAVVDEEAAEAPAPASKPRAPAATKQTTVSKSADAMRRLRMRFVTEVGDRVFFAENSDTLGGRARAIVESQARWLKKSEGLNVTIIGRAADGGSAADNKALSLARARAVEAKLVAAGLDAGRITIQAVGNTDPVATCTSAMCEAQNRHVESFLRYAGSEGAQISSRGNTMVRDETQARARQPSPR